MSDAIFDVYQRPAGERLEACVARVLAAFRKRHGREPAAVWVNPSVDFEGDTVAGLPLLRGTAMSAWYVYLEVPGKSSDGARKGAPVQLGLFELAAMLPS